MVIIEEYRKRRKYVGKKKMERKVSKIKQI
jgi:hypothetical protein